MSAMMDARKIHNAVEAMAPFISAPLLQRMLRDFANEHGLPWVEQRTERYNDEGERIGPELLISPEGAAMMTRAAGRIAEAFDSSLRVYLPLPEVAYEDRPCDDPACRAETHEWLVGECTEACSLEPIVHPEDWFRVHAGKSPGADLWEVWVDANNLPDGAQLLDVIHELTDDIEKMQQRVEALNEKVVRA